MTPRARRKDLLVEKVGDELVIYDLERQRLHQLNRAAALVWQSCDGRKTVADLKKVLQTELSTAADEAVVWKALDRLGKARLLKEPVRQPAGMTRRQVLGKLGRTAALAFLAPVVTSIIAPTPVHGQALYSCDNFICVFGFCPDQCNGDYACRTCTKPCEPDFPSCQLLTCSGPNSEFCGLTGPCPQRRCVKPASPPEI
jgi:hypothetical protein